MDKVMGNLVVIYNSFLYFGEENNNISTKVTLETTAIQLQKLS